MIDIDKVKELSDKHHGSHCFLAEELIVPNLNKVDGTRINLFDSHFIQSVVPIDGDFPNVFTNFENQIGKYSSSYKTADRDWKILKRIDKNELNYSLILLDEENKHLHVVSIKEAERITEKYGYKYESLVNDKKENDTIEKGSLIYRSTAHDNDLNFRFGRNLKTLFLAYDNMTYEDALVISQSTAKKLSCYNVEEIEISINTNDILINKYGKNGEYKSFPDINEDLDDRIVCARRRIDNDSILVDLMDSNLSKINIDNDAVFYSGGKGKVIDIDIFSNNSIENLKKFKYNNQLIKYIENNERYHKEIVDCLREYYENDEYTKSDDLNYLFKRSLDYINPNRSFRFENKTFDNIVLIIKVMFENKVTMGSKLSGRYGKK